MASWPEGKEFATLEPMMHITLNVILRVIFGPTASSCSGCVSSSRSGSPSDRG